MKPVIYFLSKVGPGNRGGQLIRAAQVRFFRERGFRVIYVTPAMRPGPERGDPDVLEVPVTVPHRVSMALQYVGLVDDYLHQWARNVVATLSGRVRQQDIVFASAGGELGCLRAGTALKSITGCSYIANLHDPTTYSHVGGIRVGRRPHVSRDRWEGKYLANADAVLTSTRSYARSLAEKYPALAPRIRHAYFGYVKAITIHERVPHAPLRIVYGGTFLKTQSPERLAEAAVDMPGVNIVYIGHHESYRPLDAYRDRITCLQPMSHDAYNEYLAGNIDVGFVALAQAEWQFCVPSKIYEYINAGIPILGALPQGEAADLINESEYGIAVEFGDTDGLRRAIADMCNPNRWQHFRGRILEDRRSWELSVRMADVMTEILDGVVGVPGSTA